MFSRTLVALLLAVAVVGCDSATSLDSVTETQAGADEATVLLAGLADTPNAKAPSQPAGRPADVIPDQYIVVFTDGVADVPAVAKRLAQGGDLLYTYESALQGFAVRLPEAAVAALRAHPLVASVEPDQEVRVGYSTQTMNTSGDPWGLDRVNQRYLALDRKYTYTYTGTGVRAYVIDTGLQANHTQFGGRAQNVYDAFGGNGADCNGHGTHVGGTIGGSTYGVAKKVQLRGLKVLGCDGGGSTSGIIAAVDWLRQNAQRPAVANMSLGGGYSSALNTAVNNLANSGVFVAVAAGNEGQNACNVSPASASFAFTTAASTKTDARASYSNYGSCVDAYAPGSAIKSAWINGGVNTINGTSMASPHVAGVAALVKHRYGDVSSSSIHQYLIDNSTSGVVTGNPSGTPNRLLYKFQSAL